MKLFSSLGFDCYVTWTLRRCQFQNSGSLPFDWMNSYKIKGVGEFFNLANEPRGLEFLKNLPRSMYDPPSPPFCHVQNLI